jgi:hypothetical protein
MIVMDVGERDERRLEARGWREARGRDGERKTRVGDVAVPGYILAS